MDVVHTASTEIANREEQNIVIFIYSQAIIKAISSVVFFKDISSFEYQYLIIFWIKDGRNVVLQVTVVSQGTR